MGMDVMGRAPTSEEGEYFRNNVWWWRPLWDFCYTAGDGIISEELHAGGHFNDGQGLDAEGAYNLGQSLLKAIESGFAAKCEEEFNAYRAEMPMESCIYCSGTGIRKDEVGIANGFPEKELEPLMAAATGRTHGYCNACQGFGSVESMVTNYTFKVDNVRNFANFLIASGGFNIW